MSRPSIDVYYLAMLPLIASRATCPRRIVAAILVDQSGKLVSIGYNGVPSGMPHCIDNQCAGAADASGNLSNCIAIHAEVNALSQSRASRRLPHTLYCSVTPCFDCAKQLITEGIKRVIAACAYTDQRGAELLKQAGIVVEVVAQPNRPRIICLCGSTKYKDTFIEANRMETLAGHIVLSVGLFMHAGDSITPLQKQSLDELHKRKIDLADEILVLNVDGYIGESTRGEIEYAMSSKKLVRYLEVPND